MPFKGHIYGTGINNQGQFGYHEEVKDHPLQVLLSPVPTRLPIKNDQIKAKRVECGQVHSVILTNEGQIFTLGNNAFGQCGRPIIQNEDYFVSKVIHPVDIPLEDSDTIVDIECGNNHSLFLSQKGCVYSCGWSADGQTGLGHYDNQTSPALIKGDIQGEKIVKVACSADNVLALNGKKKLCFCHNYFFVISNFISDKGEVFGWGNSEYGQFKMVTEEQQINSPVS